MYTSRVMIFLLLLGSHFCLGLEAYNNIGKTEPYEKKVTKFIQTFFNKTLKDNTHFEKKDISLFLEENCQLQKTSFKNQGLPFNRKRKIFNRPGGMRPPRNKVPIESELTLYLLRQNNSESYKF